MIAKAYLVIGLMLVGFYAFAEARGLDFPSEPKQFVPSDVRSSPGGYRSFHFWHSGYHGGK